MVAEEQRVQGPVGQSFEPSNPTNTAGSTHGLAWIILEKPPMQARLMNGISCVKLLPVRITAANTESRTPDSQSQTRPTPTRTERLGPGKNTRPTRLH